MATMKAGREPLETRSSRRLEDARATALAKAVRHRWDLARQDRDPRRRATWLREHGELLERLWQTCAAEIAWSVVQRRVFDPSLREDALAILGEQFPKCVSEHYRPGRATGGVTGWWRKVCENRVLDFLRSTRTKRQREGERESLEVAADQRADLVGVVDPGYACAEELDVLRRFARQYVESAPERERTRRRRRLVWFGLVCVGDVPQKVVAAQQGISASVVCRGVGHVREAYLLYLREQGCL